MQSSKIENLIFDLGGVIVDLSVEDTLKAFSRVSGHPIEYVVDKFKTSPEFNNYEKGLMTDNEFRAFVRNLYSISISDSDLDACWNAMLLGILPSKLELLQSLKKKYQVYLLSNTNEIHLAYINTVILNGRNLDTYFHKAYYSQRMLKRKPEPEIFQQVLDENNLDTSETLFLDDNVSNIAAAQALGIQTVHVTSTQLILDYFHG